MDAYAAAHYGWSMEAYRVAVDPPDPLAVDEALAARQRRAQQLVIHAFVALVTFGCWFPVFLFMLVAGPMFAAQYVTGYSARIVRGQLVVGNSTNSRSVPLDAIAEVGIAKGFVNIKVRSGQPLPVYGLRDPQAASQAILDARDEHLRGLRPDVRGDARFDTNDTARAERSAGR